VNIAIHFIEAREREREREAI